MPTSSPDELGCDDDHEEREETAKDVLGESIGDPDAALDAGDRRNANH